MEDLLLKDEMEFLVQPEHFQSVLGFIGILLSIGLVVALYDMLLNPNFGIYRLLIFGLTFCLLITMVNLASASTVLLRPVTQDTPETMSKRVDAIKIPARTIRTGDYEYDWEMLVDNQIVAAAILGFGFVLSVIFIFLTMIRSIGNSFLLKLLSLIAKIGHLSNTYLKRSDLLQVRCGFHWQEKW